MILTAIYHMFTTGEEFNPCDLYKIDMPQEMQNKQKEKAVKEAVRFLITQGVIKASDISIQESNINFFLVSKVLN